MEDEQRLFERAQMCFQILAGDVIQKPFADGERPAGKPDFGFAFGSDALDILPEIVGDMGGVCGCPDCHNSHGFGHAMSGGDDSGSTK